MAYHRMQDGSFKQECVCCGLHFHHSSFNTFQFHGKHMLVMESFAVNQTLTHQALTVIDFFFSFFPSSYFPPLFFFFLEPWLSKDVNEMLKELVLIFNIFIFIESKEIMRIRPWAFRSYKVMKGTRFHTYCTLQFVGNVWILARRKNLLNDN